MRCKCLSRAQIEKEDTVLLIGAGALGSSILKILKLHAPKKIIVSDIEDSKLEEALKNGATDVINSKYEDVSEKCHELTEGYGVTLTIDAACVRKPFDCAESNRKCRKSYHHGIQCCTR